MKKYFGYKKIRKKKKKKKKKKLKTVSSQKYMNKKYE